MGTITPKAQPGNPKKRLFRLIDDTGLSTEWVSIMMEHMLAQKDLKKQKRDYNWWKYWKNTETKMKMHLMII